MKSDWCISFVTVLDKGREVAGELVLKFLAVRSGGLGTLNHPGYLKGNNFLQIILRS